MPRAWLLLFVLVPSAKVRALEAAELFMQQCAVCHGKDGAARTPSGRKLGAKDLGAGKLPADEVARQIRDGTKAPDGASRMPAFKEKLSAAEIDALAAYVIGMRKA